MSEPMPNRNKPPCKGCEQRQYGCHDRCQRPEYLAWRAEAEKIRKAREAYRQPAWGSQEADPGIYRKHKRYK